MANLRRKDLFLKGKALKLTFDKRSPVYGFKSAKFAAYYGGDPETDCFENH